MSGTLDWNGGTITDNYIMKRAILLIRREVTRIIRHVGSSSSVGIPICVRWVERHRVKSLIQICWHVAGVGGGIGLLGSASKNRSIRWRSSIAKLLCRIRKR